MRPIRPRGATALVALLVVLAGCGAPPRGVDRGSDAPPPASSEPAPDDRRPSAYDLESEGEFPPPSRDVEFEEDQLPPRPESVTSTPLNEDAAPIRQESVPPSVTTPVAPRTTTPAPPTSATETRRGWRIQLVASADRAEAERLAGEARTRLQVPVYVELDAGLFKVRAGDFVDRAEAQILRDQAKAKGYDGAWVVTTEVRPPAGSGS